MKQVQRVLARYSSDLFGMCSSLYELGGLCVMHDASGCNSTYDTHDEPRWFDIDSMIYISALTESDAVMGNDEKLIDEIIEVAEAEHPKFIAIGGSPIPMMMGTDFEGIARVIEKRTGVPSFGIRSSGMRSYEAGAGQALACLVNAFCLKAVPSEQALAAAAERNSVQGIRSVRVNILGVTPLDFSVTGNAEGLVQFFEQNGCTVVSSWAMNDALEQLSQAGTADVNVVVSASGLLPAEKLHNVYGTPYVTGLPLGKNPSCSLLDRVYEAAGAEKLRKWNTDVHAEPSAQYRAAASGIPLLDDACLPADAWKALHRDSGYGCIRKRESPFKTIQPVLADDPGQLVYIIGEPVFASSLRACLEQDYGARNVRIICPLEETCGVLRECDLHTDEEDDFAAAAEIADVVIADPVYRRILPRGKSVQFVDFPHEAYSGRLYRSGIPMFIGSRIL
jgi:nitrogenase molybdenum-cofactor synthesis protein NifE